VFSTTRPGVEAYKKGSPSIADELVFPGKDGTPLASRRLLDTYFVPVLQHAGLRRFRSHDLRHTFGSLLIEEGAPHPYFRDQLGHSSIQITADKYVHLVARRNVHFIDRLDEQTSPQPNATPAQPQAKGCQRGTRRQRRQLIERKAWCERGDSNPHPLRDQILSLVRLESSLRFAPWAIPRDGCDAMATKLARI
jgi:hypothetical protein